MEELRFILEEAISAFYLGYPGPRMLPHVAATYELIDSYRSRYPMLVFEMHFPAVVAGVMPRLAVTVKARSPATDDQDPSGEPR